jgi:hypothetical protein
MHIPPIVSIIEPIHSRSTAARGSLNGSGVLQVVELFSPLPLSSTRAVITESNKVCIVNNVQVIR